MPRPMLKTPQNQAQNDNILSATRSNQKQQKMDKMMIDRLFRKPRSDKYMDAIHKLDAGGHVHNQKQVDNIIDIIKGEFPEVEISGVLLGIVAICYLGEPYEVHILDMSGEIIEHYKAGQRLPNGLEKARGIAMRGGYDFIEVYVDCCRAINADGSVAVIPC